MKKLHHKAAAPYLILGCMDREEGYAVPVEVINAKLASLNKTETDERMYWHISLQLEENQLFLNMTKTGERMSLESYRF